MRVVVKAAPRHRCVARGLPSCANNSRTAVSSCESRPVYDSPTGRFTGMSTCRGACSIIFPDASSTRVPGSRTTLPSSSGMFDV